MKKTRSPFPLKDVDVSRPHWLLHRQIISSCIFMWFTFFTFGFAVLNKDSGLLEAYESCERP
jgi:hypothetical protein